MKLKGWGPRARRGQAIVEFALIVPLALLLILGTFDLSIMGTDTGLAVAAARHGARTASESGGTSNLPASCTGTLDPAVTPQNTLPEVDKTIVKTVLAVTSNMDFMGGVSGKAPLGQPEAIYIYSATTNADGTLDTSSDHYNKYVFTDGFATRVVAAGTPFTLLERCQGPLPFEAEIGVRIDWTYKPANGIPGPSFSLTNYAVEKMTLCSDNCR